MYVCMYQIFYTHSHTPSIRARQYISTYIYLDVCTYIHCSASILLVCAGRGGDKKKKETNGQGQDNMNTLYLHTYKCMYRERERERERARTL